MLCDKCKMNTAAVHVERAVNNVKKEYYLCVQCAASMDAEMSFDNIIKEFLGQVIELGNGKFFSFGDEEKAGCICSACGMTYNGFRETGQLGCTECYKAFSQQLGTILKNIHGSVEHSGKIPGRASKKILQKRELNTLKTKLREAVANEEFETAAELRDRIRAVEAGGVL